MLTWHTKVIYIKKGPKIKESEVNKMSREREITIEQCSSFNRCSAPLCPLDPLLKQCCWFPDDDVCRKSFPPQWIKTQRKISARTKNMDTYYLFKM